MIERVAARYPVPDNDVPRKLDLRRILRTAEAFAAFAKDE